MPFKVCLWVRACVGVCACAGPDYACNKRGYMIYYIVTYYTVVVLNKWHNVKPTDEQGIPI